VVSEEEVEEEQEEEAAGVETSFMAVPIPLIRGAVEEGSESDPRAPTPLSCGGKQYQDHSKIFLPRTGSWGGFLFSFFRGTGDEGPVPCEDFKWRGEGRGLGSTAEEEAAALKLSSRGCNP
jgi:hypothetical protein